MHHHLFDISTTPLSTPYRNESHTLLSMHLPHSLLILVSNYIHRDTFTFWTIYLDSLLEKRGRSTTARRIREHWNTGNIRILTLQHDAADSMLQTEVLQKSQLKGKVSLKKLLEWTPHCFHCCYSRTKCLLSLKRISPVPSAMTSIEILSSCHAATASVDSVCSCGGARFKNPTAHFVRRQTCQMIHPVTWR